MSRKRKLKFLIENLDSLRTEEEILECLISIVKGYPSYEYDYIVFANPYYKSLIPDIKKEVLKEVVFLRESIMTEIDNINSQMQAAESENFEKLTKLKQECQALIYEIDEKYKDIENLS